VNQVEFFNLPLLYKTIDEELVSHYEGVRVSFVLPIEDKIHLLETRFFSGVSVGLASNATLKKDFLVFKTLLDLSVVLLFVLAFFVSEVLRELVANHEVSWCNCERLLKVSVLLRHLLSWLSSGKHTPHQHTSESLVHFIIYGCNIRLLLNDSMLRVK